MSGLQSTGYEGARPTHVCAASGRRFQPGERYFATLIEDPDTQELSRFDFAEAAWTSGSRPPGRTIAVWRPVASDRPERRSALLGAEELLGLFEGIEPAESGRAAVFRYLLALLLVRKRVLSIADQSVGAGGRPVLRLVRRGGAADVATEPFEVVDPGMNESAIGEGIEELGVLLADEGQER